MFHGRDQFFDALCESHQLEIELCFCGVAHVGTIERLAQRCKSTYVLFRHNP
jgi:hypothetical protein